MSENTVLGETIARMAAEFAAQERKEIIKALTDARRALAGNVQHEAVPGINVAIKLIKERG